MKAKLPTINLSTYQSIYQFNLALRLIELAFFWTLGMHCEIILRPGIMWSAMPLSDRVPGPVHVCRFEGKGKEMLFHLLIGLINSLQFADQSSRPSDGSEKIPGIE
jgi:hypothetical protein